MMRRWRHWRIVRAQRRRLHDAFGIAPDWRALDVLGAALLLAFGALPLAALILWATGRW